MAETILDDEQYRSARDAINMILHSIWLLKMALPKDEQWTGSDLEQIHSRVLGFAEKYNIDLSAGSSEPYVAKSRK